MPLYILSEVKFIWTFVRLSPSSSIHPFFWGIETYLSSCVIRTDNVAAGVSTSESQLRQRADRKSERLLAIRRT